MFSPRNIIIWSVCIISLILYYPYTYSPYSEFDKCPLCYGCRLCLNSALNVTFEHNFFSFLFNIKNIYYGKYNDVSVLIKKLASNSELSDFDAHYYERYDEIESDLIKYVNNLNFDFKNIVKLLRKFNGINSFSLCRINGHTENILNQHLNLFRRDHFNDINEEDFFKAVWFILEVNPEPIILHLFQAADNWPVPVYFGSCGRLAVFQDCGKPLYNLLSETWILRIYIAQQLLLTAFNFTFSHPNFSLYLTDLTMDNVVVDSNYVVRVVDLENVILVGRTNSAKDFKNSEYYAKMNNVHKTEHWTCDNCLIFSTEDICSHDVSDHNIYAVCKEFFASTPSLLTASSGPIRVTNEMERLVNDCIQPSDNNSVSRFTTGIKLLHILEDTLSSCNFSIDEYK